MPFRLHAVRHAEGIHNPMHDHSIRDPPLIPKGIHQSEHLSQIFPFKQNVGLVTTSPLRRTLQTTLFGFQQTLDEKYYTGTPEKGQPDGARLLLEPDVQAHSARPSDTGSDKEALQSEFPHLPWDEFSFDPLFPAKEGLYAKDPEALHLRGKRVHRLLEKEFKALAGSGRPDIVVVTHGGFMKYVVLDDKMAFESAGWRSFLVEFDSNHNMSIREVEHSALEWAAENGHEGTARKAQEGGASLNCDYDGWKPITLAAANGHDALVRLFLEQGVNPIPNPEDPEQDSAIRSLLVLAARNGYESFVRLFLEHGATADRPVVGRYQTTLSVAAEEGHLGIVELLAQAQCDIQFRGINGWTPLIHAAKKGRVDVVRFLLDYGVDHNIGTDGETAICWAAQGGHLEVVKLLLENGADPEPKSSTGAVLYPLTWAIEHEHYTVAQLLLMSINLETKIQSGSHDENAALLSVAAACGWGDLLQRLLEHGCPADARSSDNRIFLKNRNLSALSIAAERGHHHIVEQLLRYNADANPPSATTLAPIVLAVSKGNVRISQSLLDHGADPNTRDAYGSPILFKAMPFESIFELLPDRGADPNTKANYGRVDIFEETLSSGNLQLVRILLARKNILSWTDMSRFQSAVLRGGEAMVRFAMIPVSFDGKETRGNMYEAASYGDAGLVKFFLDQGAQLGLAPHDSIALTMATYRVPPKATAEIASILLDHGANVNSLFRFCWKPLLKSIDENEAAIQLLLERGAYPFTRSFDSPDSPLADAVRKGSVNVVEYLLDAIDRWKIPGDDIRRELFYAASEAANYGDLFIERLIEHYYWRRKYPCT